uniref:Uncharacterized protein n=1 Tax=Arundo donax TaxID=35708 RepID=A0A0A9F7S4_ARUDO
MAGSMSLLISWLDLLPDPHATI